MKNLILLFLLFGCTANYLYAADGTSSLIIHAKDGSTATYLLARCPIVTFSGDSLKIYCDDTEVIYALDNVTKFTYGEKDENIGVSYPTSTDSSRLFSYDGEQVVLSGLKPGCMVYVLSSDGCVVASERCDSDCHTLFISGLSTGVYIVTANGMSFKLLKK